MKPVFFALFCALACQSASAGYHCTVHRLGPGGKSARIHDDGTGRPGVRYLERVRALFTEHYERKLWVEYRFSCAGNTRRECGVQGALYSHVIDNGVSGPIQRLFDFDLHGDDVQEFSYGEGQRARVSCRR